MAFIGATVISSQLARPMSRLIQPALERSITQVLEEQTHAVLPPPETSEASPAPALSDAFSGEEGPGRRGEDWLAQLPLDEVLDALQASSLYQHFIQPIQDAIQDGVMEVTTSRRPGGGGLSGPGADPDVPLPGLPLPWSCFSGCC